jgi:hypothetical protein
MPKMLPGANASEISDIQEERNRESVDQNMEFYTVALH